MNSRLVLVTLGIADPVYYVKIILWTTVCIAGIVFIYVEGMIISGFSKQGGAGLEYIIVLGAKVNAETPSRSLKYRIDKAYEYLSENENTIAVLSGGQGPDEEISEAECMKKTLIKAGISEVRLLLENRSTNTKENFAFSEVLVGDKHKSVGIVTNNFHVYRAVRIARKSGFTAVEGIAAKSEPTLQLKNMLREFFAIVKEKLVGNI